MSSDSRYLARLGAILVVLLAGISSLGSAQSSKLDVSVLFPDASPPIRQDGEPRPLKSHEAIDIVLVSYRFKPSLGLSEAIDTTWCGMVLRDARRPPVGLVTIGKGFTEALTCIGLSEAGTVPSLGDVARIALVYRTASPNAAGSTPVILIRDPSSHVWSIDTALSQQLAEDAEPATLASIRRALSR